MNKVSLIVPIYNAEAFLADCINSILNQTYKNIELILINDGSCDNSLQICYDFLAQDNRIVIIEKDNSGAAETRNVGIQHATGTYAMFIDADDWIEKTCVETLVSAIEDTKCDVAIGCLVDVYGEKKQTQRTCPISTTILTKEDIYNFLVIDKLYGNKNDYSPYWNGFTTCLYCLDILKSMRIYFPKIRIGEDFVFLMSYFCACNSATIVPAGVYYYRHYGNSVSSTYAPNLVDQNSIFIEHIQKILDKLPVSYEDAFSRFVARAVTSEFSNALCNGRNYKTIRAELKYVRQSNHYMLYAKSKNLIPLPWTAKVIFWLLHHRLYDIVAFYYVFIQKRGDK